MSLRKQLIFNNYFWSTPTLLEVGKSSKMHIFILALGKIHTSSKQNIYLDQWKKCSKKGKHKNILWFQRTLSTLGRQILFILVIVVFNTHVTASRQVEFTIAGKKFIIVFCTLELFWEYLCNKTPLKIGKREKKKRVRFDLIICLSAFRTLIRQR